MFQKHWKSWACPYQCGLDGTTETNLRQHITRIHGSKTDMELDAMIARCGRTRSISPSSPVECPLCQDALESVQQYQRHVGRHQVDLALFALPKIEDDDDDDDDDEPDETNEDHETISTHSGSYSEAMSGGISPWALGSPAVSITGIHEVPEAMSGDSSHSPIASPRTPIIGIHEVPEAMSGDSPYSPIASPPSSIIGIHEVHETEIVDNEAEGQDSERSADESDDVEIRVREAEIRHSRYFDSE